MAIISRTFSIFLVCYISQVFEKTSVEGTELECSYVDLDGDNHDYSCLAEEEYCCGIFDDDCCSDWWTIWWIWVLAIFAFLFFWSIIIALCCCCCCTWCKKSPRTPTQTQIVTSSPPPPTTVISQNQQQTAGHIPLYPYSMQRGQGFDNVNYMGNQSCNGGATPLTPPPPQYTQFQEASKQAEPPYTYAVI